MVLHDLGCAHCNVVESNAVVYGGVLPPCPHCGHYREIVWSCRSASATIHPRERAVVWANSKTGSVAYPPANDAPMPRRYSSNGYERVEMTSLRQLDDFCKRRGLVNEKASFDNSGHADEL